MGRKNKRKSLSKKVRFEVFKRDSFRCQYCGRTAPDVILEVDHIKPVAEGGTNSFENLITACKECNAGKGARSLDDRSVLKKQRQQLEELNERREQLEMMMQWREELIKIDEEKVDRVKEYFEKLAKCSVTEHGREVLKKLIRKHSLEAVLDAIEASTAQYLVVQENSYTKESREKAFEYIGKICAIKKVEEDKPYIRDLFYIRGILKNRLNYCDKSKALLLMERAYLEGASIEGLKDVALSVRNWTEWRSILEDFIYNQQSDKE